MSLYSSQFGDIYGIGTARETYENAFTWGRKEAGLITGFVISGAARDTGNTENTATLRPGLLLGTITSSGKLTTYSPTATDGSQNVTGVLLVGLRMTDLISGSNLDKITGILVGGPVQASKILNLDAKARANMFGRFVFDDDYVGRSGGGWIDVVAKTTSYTVTASDTDRIFTNQGASGSVTFTLPTIAKGLRYRFMVEADQTVVVTAASADTMVAYNDATATSVAYQTSSEKVGGAFEVIANADATKWLAFSLIYDGQTATVA